MTNCVQIEICTLLLLLLLLLLKAAKPGSWEQQWPVMN